MHPDSRAVLMTPVSIFNEVIGPVMRGPSSSHCAAALRIGRIARDLMDGDIREVLLEMDAAGSLPTTHESQGSDMGLFGGLLGWDADDERLPQSGKALTDAGIHLTFRTIEAGDAHPNTYRLTLCNAREKHTLIAISTGGGMIEVQSVDGVALRMDGGYHETLVWLERQQEVRVDADEVLVHSGDGFCLVQIRDSSFVSLGDLPALSVRRIHPVLPVPSRKGIEVPFMSCSQMLEVDGDLQTPLWQLASQYEQARGHLTEQAVLDQMVRLVRILRRSVDSGLKGTDYEDRVLGFQSGRFREGMDSGQLLQGGAVNRIVLYVTALMEVKSSMGVIVAAPTAGACAALPGSVLAMAEEMGLGEVDMARAMLSAGLVGVFIATRWTFAAEVGGCQAEGGAAACMAAAALVTLAGGTRDQAVAAASMALQNMLGLICDPIANRVEAPCLGKNVMAATNAFACANMALSQFDSLIPLDEVIDAARDVSRRMPREHRCTSLGGLAATPTSQDIERRLAARKEACGSCSC